MSKFIPTTKRNGACYVCGDESGKCRRPQHGDIHLCMTYGDARIGQLENGYKCIANKGRGWATFKLDNTQNWTDQQRSNWQERKARRQQQQHAEAEARKRRSLDAVSRDRQYRQLLAELTLHPSDRASLIRRGFTHQEIDLCGFKSVEQYQQLQARYSELLPGIGVNGHSLVNYHAGYLCPVRNKDGLIVACQLRLRVLPSGEKNRYRWLASGKRGHILHFFPESGNPEGELPLAVQRPMGEPKGIALAEGTGAKPFLVSQRLNLLVIGAAGGQWAISSATFRETLDSLSAELDGLKIIHLYPDAGDVQNPQVMHRLRRVIALLTKWGWTVQVGWWGQVDKSHPDIDELADKSAITYLNPEEFLALGEQSGGTFSHSFAGLSGWLPRIKKRIDSLRQSPWGFGMKGEVKVDPIPALVPPAIEYQPGERLEVWNTSTKFMWDSSGTGTGKTFDSGRVTPVELGCERMFYVTNDPRNPSTPTLALWGYLDGRHNGIKRDSHGKLRRVEKGEPYLIAPNCGRVETIGAIREAGIQGADSSETVCRTCPQYEACKGGYVYGYLHKRLIALNQDEPISRLIAHPSSLPQTEGTTEREPFPYSKYAIIWEEWTTVLKNSRQIAVEQNDLDKLIAHLATSAPEIFTTLQPLLASLRWLMCHEKQPNRYGWNHHALLDELSAVPDDINLDALASVTQPDLSFLNPTGEHGVDTADLPAGVRKDFTSRDETTASQARTTLLKQWIIPFLRILKGENGYLTLCHGQLTITTPDSRLIEIAHAAQRNIFLDATGHLKELALLLGVETNEIIHVRQYQPPTTNLEHIQVGTLGRLGQSRGESQQLRATAVVDAVRAESPDNTGVMRFKRHAQTGDYRYFIESRGVNDGEKITTLILDGIPTENLESLAAQFACLYGRPPKPGTETIRYQVQLKNELPAGIEPYFDMKVSADPEFREFVQRRTRANILQAIGRLRANRRPGEQLRVFILGDFPLDMPVKLVKASEITLEAADTQEQNLLGIFRGLMATATAGVKQTQAAIATAAHTTQGQVSKILSKVGGMERVKKIFQTLIEPLSNWNNFVPDDEQMWMAQTFLALVLENEPENLAESVANLANVYGSDTWIGMVSWLKAEVRVAAIAQFVQLMPEQLRRELTKLLPLPMQRQIAATTTKP